MKGIENGVHSCTLAGLKNLAQNIYRIVQTWGGYLLVWLSWRSDWQNSETGKWKRERGRVQHTCRVSSCALTGTEQPEGGRAKAEDKSNRLDEMSQMVSDRRGEKEEKERVPILKWFSSPQEVMKRDAKATWHDDTQATGSDKQVYTSNKPHIP